MIPTLKVPLLALIGIIWCGTTFAQPHAEPAPLKLCSFSGIYRTEGWAIPGIPAVKPNGERVPLAASMPHVFVTRVKPAETETTITSISCSSALRGRLQVSDQPIGVIWLASFDFSGRVFAYGVRFVKERVEGNVRRAVAAESNIIFYDLDGLGRFTLMEGAERGLTPNFIPDWVKEDAKSVPPK
jgi:hypothetical protein